MSNLVIRGLLATLIYFCLSSTAVAQPETSVVQLSPPQGSSDTDAKGVLIATQGSGLNCLFPASDQSRTFYALHLTAGVGLPVRVQSFNACPKFNNTKGRGSSQLKLGCALPFVQ